MDRIRAATSIGDSLQSAPLELDSQALPMVPADPAPFFVFVGRLHPALVHFPIALYVAAALFEMLEWSQSNGRGFTRRKASTLAMRCLGLGAAVGVAAAISGWISANVEPQSRAMEETLELHRWIGVGSTCGALLALLFAGMDRLNSRSGFLGLYRMTLMGATIAMGYGAYLGGELVHGKDYLFSMFTETSISAADVPAREFGGAPPAWTSSTPTASGAVDFANQVQPLLEARCIECHGPKKQKGELRLDTLALALESPGVIVPGDALESSFYRRVTLPADHEDHMPAKGEPLSEEELRIVRSWIDGMAPRTN